MGDEKSAGMADLAHAQCLKVNGEQHKLVGRGLGSHGGWFWGWVAM